MQLLFFRANSRPRDLRLRVPSALLALLSACFLGATHHAHGGTMAPAQPISGSVFATLGAPATPGAIVVDTRSGDLELLSYGNASFGGSLGAEGQATRSYVDFPTAADSPSNYRSSGALFADVTVLGSSYPAGRLEVSARNEPYTLSIWGATAKVGYQPATRLQLELAGSTVFDQTLATTSFTHGWAVNLGPYDTPEISYSYSLWVASLTVRAQAGASAQASLTASADLASVSLSLEGDASAACHGQASASVSVLFGLAKAKLTGALDFGGPSLELAAGAGVFSGAGGHVEVCMRPIDLQLDLYGEVRWFRRSASQTWHLVDWSRAESCTLFTF